MLPFRFVTKSLKRAHHSSLSTNGVHPREHVKRADASFKYCTTHIALSGDAAALVARAANVIDPSDLAEDGCETDPHVTVLYGLTDDDPSGVQRIATQFGPISFVISEPMVFVKPDCDVIVFRVLPDLTGNDQLWQLNQALRSLPHDNKYPEYKPHATIAYVKSGLGSKYASLIGATGNTTLPCVATELVFSDRNKNRVVIPLSDHKAARTIRRSVLPWLIIKGDTEDNDLTPEALGLIADILGGLFGDDALSMFDKGPWVSKAWNPAHHPRGKNGRFIKRGSDEAVNAAKEQVRNILKGPKTADTHKSLVEHLQLLTVKQLQALRKEHGLKCPERLRDQLIQTLAERLGAKMPDGSSGPSDGTEYGHNILYNVDEQQADAMIDKVFGRKDSHQIIGHAVGAPRNAEIVVESVEPYPDDPNSMGVVISIRHPDLEGCTRYIGIDGKGKRFIKNEYIRVKELGSGIGMEIFTRQVEQASKMGFAYIGTHAAGEARHQRSFLQAIHRNFPETASIDDTAKAINELKKTVEGRAFLDKVYVPFNGYYTWPRFGYDMSLTDPKGLQEGDASVYEAARAKFPDAKTLLDIFETEEGRQWWKDNGTDVYNAKFDLSPNSRSMKVLKAYQSERAARKKWLRNAIYQSKMKMRLKKCGVSVSNNAKPSKSCLPWLSGQFRACIA